MEIAQIFVNVFGEYPTLSSSKVNYKDYTLEEYVPQKTEFSE